ncbi:SCF E3 ubiquitin ligase complex F-box protein pof2-like [Trifolium pratense]|uniref:SCF E3 ubiquitin ligase complex F-box protein pof2-like n=1 Tax=Trifolium pratense TaxID=57577 RepID=UPI001E695BF0|nr:SCF E3 ubiquitin ligase complex F-box protein pof2-like [Trifolium pratense]XP_045786045.1 SCF E3 ubiquitin ligase complex F-box protein pof2-like [Trifolium pratense]
MASSSQSNRRKTILADLHLPLECWECIISFLVDHNRSLESLSLVSKQFLFITNRLRFSFTICLQTFPFLPILLRRFTNLTSLNLSGFRGNLNRLLRKICRFPLKLTSLNLSNQCRIPANGLRAFSKKITTLTTLTCSNTSFICSTDISLISDCFPLLEVLDLSDPHFCEYEEAEPLLSTLFKLRKVNLSRHHYIDDKLIFQLFKNCKLLEEAIMLFCYRITFDGIASALRQRPALRSLSFSITYGQANQEYNESYITSQFIASLVSLKYLTCLDLLSSNIFNELLFSIANEGLPLKRLVLQNCAGYTYSGIFYLLSKCQHCQHLDLQNAVFLTDKHVVELSLYLGDLVSINLSHCSLLTVSAFFALIKSCPSLSDIKMENTSIGKKSLESSKSLMDFTSRPQLKYLHLAHNPWLTDENIIMFASISPNLLLFDLSGCCGIGEGVAQVLRMCCNIRHLNLSRCSRVKLLEMNFKVPKLEVLNLSYTNVDDETLYMISKSCRGLLQLSLKCCIVVTEIGVKLVVENCTQLREIECYGINIEERKLLTINLRSLHRVRWLS